MGVVDEFAFATDEDKLQHLAVMLTAAIRQSLPLAPMVLVKAPQYGSGKSYLSALIAAFGSPDTPSAVGFPRTEEECLPQLVAGHSSWKAPTAHVRQPDQRPDSLQIALFCTDRDAHHWPHSGGEQNRHCAHQAPREPTPRAL